MYIDTGGGTSTGANDRGCQRRSAAPGAPDDEMDARSPAPGSCSSCGPAKTCAPSGHREAPAFHRVSPGSLRDLSGVSRDVVLPTLATAMTHDRRKFFPHFALKLPKKLAARTFGARGLTLQVFKLALGVGSLQSVLAGPTRDLHHHPHHPHPQEHPTPTHDRC
jgi:hypothetical protein